MRNLYRALSLVMLTSFSYFSSAQTAQSDSLRIHELTNKVSVFEYKWLSLQSQIKSLEQEVIELKAVNASQADAFEAAMERMSQSERAMTTTLNSYQERFEAQNETIDEVKLLLSDRLDQLRMYLIIGVVILIVVVYVLVRAASRAAVKSHTATLNEFQASLFKSK